MGTATATVTETVVRGGIIGGSGDTTTLAVTTTRAFAGAEVAVTMMAVVATRAATAALSPSHCSCDHRCHHSSHTVTHIVCQ